MSAELRDLRERLDPKAVTLRRERDRHALGGTEWWRLEGKAQGMELALSFVDEHIRLAGVQGEAEPRRAEVCLTCGKPDSGGRVCACAGEAEPPAAERKIMSRAAAAAVRGEEPQPTPFPMQQLSSGSAAVCGLCGDRWKSDHACRTASVPQPNPGDAMNLVHFSREPFGTWIDKPMRPGYKPSGLWVSDEDDETSWSAWCAMEDFDGVGPYAHHVELVFDRVLHLRTADELRSFTATYLTVRDRWADRIDWPRLAGEYGGVLITPYQWECRLGLDTSWYYGWDCASGCIWSADAIASITAVERERNS